VAGAVAFLIFICSVCSVHHDISVPCVEQSVQLALGLLLAMDTPPNMLKSSPGWLIAFGWAISLAGWLFIPLFCWTSRRDCTVSPGTRFRVFGKAETAGHTGGLIRATA
jgi:hypothetical protein